jgi:hypothetical protein
MTNLHGTQLHSTLPQNSTWPILLLKYIFLKHTFILHEHIGQFLQIQQQRLVNGISMGSVGFLLLG